MDDGSADASWPCLLAIRGGDPRVRLIRLSRNFGHQVAVSAGLEHAGGDTVTVIDADLQDPPEVIARMVEAWREGADIVYGVRTVRRGESWFKRGTAKLFYRTMRNLADVDMPVDVGDFRLLSRRAADALVSMPEHHRYVRGMVAWLGYDSTTVAYARDPRFAGETKYPLGKMVRFALDGILSFSIRPLRIATWLGVLASISGLHHRDRAGHPVHLRGRSRPGLDVTGRPDPPRLRGAARHRSARSGSTSVASGRRSGPGPFTWSGTSRASPGGTRRAGAGPTSVV